MLMSIQKQQFSFAQELELQEKVFTLGKLPNCTLGGNKATSTSEGEGELQLSFIFPVAIIGLKPCSLRHRKHLWASESEQVSSGKIADEVNKL